VQTFAADCRRLATIHLHRIRLVRHLREKVSIAPAWSRADLREILASWNRLPWWDPSI
jgi:hypothetical protein